MIPLYLLELRATHHKRSREEMAFNHKSQWRQFEYYYLELGKTFIYKSYNGVRNTSQWGRGRRYLLATRGCLISRSTPSTLTLFHHPSTRSLGAGEGYNFLHQTSCPGRSAFLCTRSGNIQLASFFCFRDGHFYISARVWITSCDP